jgi:serine/threonine protein kinase
MFVAKYVPTKTYTLCGTPLYLAPEVILNRGHGKGADHWSYAVLIYEMIAGHTPFYIDGMDQMTLFRYICKGDYHFPPAGVMTIEGEDLLQRFLVLDPAKRLGSLARGINEIYAHLWYAEIDFADLRHKDIKAPWVPEIKDPLDKSNFENWDHLEDKTLKDDPPISNMHQEIFETF